MLNSPVNLLVALTISSLLAGYVVFLGNMNKVSLIPWPADIKIGRKHCQSPSKRCPVIFHTSSVDEFNNFSLDESQALFVHFRGNSLLPFHEPLDDTEILDPLNLVWVENTKAPFLSLDLDYNVYSLTILQRKVHHMTLMVEEIMPNCFTELPYCVTFSLASAFLQQVSKQRGTLCYLVPNNMTVSSVLTYDCCINDYECNVRYVINPHMSEISKTIAVVATIFFACFPAFFVHFPYEENSSETLSSNTQVRNPFYRVANCAVQNLRHYSAQSYWVNVARKLLIGCSLPMLFYVYLGLLYYTSKYDLPLMFDSAAVKESWQGEIRSAKFKITIYGIAILFISFLPRTENLDLSSAPSSSQERVHLLRSLIRDSQDTELNWMNPFSLSKKYFCNCSFGFKGLCDGQSSVCWRVVGFICSCLLMAVFPVIAIFIFFGYTLYISPLCQTLLPVLYHAEIYIRLLFWRFDSCVKKTCIILPGAIILHTCLVLSCPVMITGSLMLISKLIVYVYMGIVVSKDEFLPLIALLSLFVFYVWNCFSSVESTYKDLLDQTFEKCKQYQEKPGKRQVISVDNKGVPRIPHLSELFQKVVDEIMSFSKAYTKMVLKIVVIGLFLVLTYSSILVYGHTILSDYTKTLAVALGGLIPKLVEIFGGDDSKRLHGKENAYRIEKIVQDFFDSDDGTSADDCGKSKSSDAGSETRKPRHRRKRSKPRQMVVPGDVNPTMESINCDPNLTETTPLLHGQSRQKTSDHRDSAIV